MTRKPERHVAECDSAVSHKPNVTGYLMNDERAECASIIMDDSKARERQRHVPKERSALPPNNGGDVKSSKAPRAACLALLGTAEVLHRHIP